MSQNIDPFALIVKKPGFIPDDFFKNIELYKEAALLKWGVGYMSPNDGPCGYAKDIKSGEEAVAFFKDNVSQLGKAALIISREPSIEEDDDFGREYSYSSYEDPEVIKPFAYQPEPMLSSVKTLFAPEELNRQLNTRLPFWFWGGELKYSHSGRQVMEKYVPAMFKTILAKDEFARGIENRSPSEILGNLLLQLGYKDYSNFLIVGVVPNKTQNQLVFYNDNAFLKKETDSKLFYCNNENINNVGKRGKGFHIISKHETDSEPVGNVESVEDKFYDLSSFLPKKEDKERLNLIKNGVLVEMVGFSVGLPFSYLYEVTSVTFPTNVREGDIWYKKAFPSTDALSLSIKKQKALVDWFNKEETNLYNVEINQLSLL